MADGQDWKEAIGLDEATRALPALKDIPDAKTAVKVLLDLQAYKGQSIRIPGADAGEEARAEFLGKLREKVPELLLVPAGATRTLQIDDLRPASTGCKNGDEDINFACFIPYGT